MLLDSTGFCPKTYTHLFFVFISSCVFIFLTLDIEYSISINQVIIWFMRFQKTLKTKQSKTQIIHLLAFLWTKKTLIE